MGRNKFIWGGMGWEGMTLDEMGGHDTRRNRMGWGGIGWFSVGRDEMRC